MPRPPRRELVRGLVAVALAVALVVSLSLAAGHSPGSSGGSSPGRPLLLSLGDSLATGTQPAAAGATDHGYADVLADRLGRSLTVLGRGGETTVSMLTGGQEAKAVAYLGAHRGDDVLVPIAIGANDVERCSRGGAFPPTCVTANLNAVRRNLPAILRRLKAAAGPHVRFVGITYYNYFLAQWRRGAEGRAVARRSIPVERAMNAALTDAYRAAGVPVADVEDAFETDDFARTLTLPRFGTQPRAVARICQWTWACTPLPGGRTDDHPNDAGYRVIARAVEARIPS